MLSNTLRLSFCYYSHSSFTLSSRINRIYSKKKKKKTCGCIHEIIYLIIVKTMMKMKNRPHRHDINSPRSRHIVNIKIVSVWWCLYVCIKQHLSSIWSSIHEKVKQHRGWVEKKRCLLKKACISLVSLMISPSSWCESVFNLFSVPSWIWSCFCVNCEKISFSRPAFVDSEIVIWKLTFLTDFYKIVHLLFKKRHVLDCQKKISFAQITHLKFTFLFPDDIKIYY